MGSLTCGFSLSALLSPQKDHHRPFSTTQHHLLRYRRFVWNTGSNPFSGKTFMCNTSATNTHTTFVCSAQQAVGIRRYPPHTGDEESSDPSNILEEIVWNKVSEVAQMKENMHLESVKEALSHALPPRDFIGTLKVRMAETGLPALIAEVKKASPSRGIIQPNFDPVRIAQAYAKGGAACLSVLTDSKYFQGSFENLQAIRHSGIQCPLLCKEFIVDEYQLYYARLKGADAVLLIASVLPDQDIMLMLSICKSLDMAALVEYCILLAVRVTDIGRVVDQAKMKDVHSTEELDRILGINGVELIGINNRDLETFTVDIRNTEKLLRGARGAIIRDRDIIVVGESGLFTPEDVAFVQRAGVGAVLVGESIVKQNDPAVGIAGLFGKDISREL